MKNDMVKFVTCNCHICKKIVLVNEWNLSYEAMNNLSECTNYTTNLG